VVDFRLVPEEIGVKLCALKERSEKGPTHLLLRLVPKTRAAETARGSGAPPAPEPEFVQFEEGEEEEQEEEVSL
jgi:hypothetical protein